MVVNSRLWELFTPDFANGVLVRNTSQGGVKAGELAGFKNKRGYYKVKVRGKSQSIHRLLFAMYHNIPLEECPPIDHIDRDTTNNNINNLRVGYQTDNCANRSVFKNSKTQYKGVSVRPNGKYEAYCVRHGKRHYLGVYNTPQEAHNAYLNKAKELHGEYCYG